MARSSSLRNFDLNLLVHLQLLLEESSVSAAAKRAAVTQSAMSRALARLREGLDDELLVQVGRGMEPTAYARQLADPLRAILRDIDTRILSPHSFSPADSEHDFTIAAVDYAEVLILGPWLATLPRDAPGVRVHLAGTKEAFRGGLTRGELDLVLGVVSGSRASLKSRRLFADTYVCAMRKGHPLADKDALELGDYATTSHILVSPSGRGDGHVDVALDRLGITRNVSVRVGSFLVGLRLVATSDLLLTVPKRIADHLQCSDDSVVFRDSGLELPDLALSMLWHTTRDNDPAHVWLREQIVAHSERFRG